MSNYTHTCMFTNMHDFNISGFLDSQIFAICIFPVLPEYGDSRNMKYLEIEKHTDMKILKFKTFRNTKIMYR